MRIRDFVFGLIYGSTAAYLLAVLFGLLLPSWPFNAFFTPLSLLVLLLLWRYWSTPVAERRGVMVKGAWSGAVALLVLWSLYFIDPVVDLHGAAWLFASVLLGWAGLVYWRNRQTADGNRRSFVLFILGAMASSYLCAALVILLFVNAGCSRGLGVFCPYAVAPFVQPLAVAVGLSAYLRLWSRPQRGRGGKC